MRKLRCVALLAGALAGCRISDLVTSPADGRVVFTVQPSGTTTAQAITPAVLVTVLDAAGNRDTAFFGVVTIRLAQNPSGAKLSGDTTASASTGRATFGNLRIDLPGSGYALRASAPDREATTSRGFDVRSNTTPPPNQPPVASFSSSCNALFCNFTDGSTDGDGSVVAWAWEFGDGGTASTQHPSHTYGSIGTFTVRLIVTDDDGARDTTTRSVSVVAPPPPQNQAPVASFASSCSVLTCAFSDGSSDSDGTITAHAWDFGDGGTATSQNPSHTYGSAGTYTTRLIVTDDDGAKDTTTRSVTVTAPPPPPQNQPPVAGFSKSCTDLTCNFTDQSSDPDGSVTAWSWNFGDGATSSSENPSHTYGSAGTYTVRLIVTDNDGARDTTTQSVAVTAPPPPPPPQNQPPVASFSSSCSDLTCSFTDGSSDADGSVTAWSWTFGDGGSASSQNPSRTYGSAGTNTVRLIVTDDDGAKDTTTRSVTVTAPPPPPQNQAPVAGFSKSCTDLTCNFTDQSSDPDGSVTAWSWNFGDGTTSSSENPSHTYGSAGTYTVRLIVTDNDGARDTTTQSVAVTAPPPPPNRPPAVDAGPDVTMVVGTYTLSAAFSDPDGADGPYGYSIDWGDGTSSNGSATASPISAFHLFAIPGTYRVRVTVTDRHGASGSDEVFVTVLLQ